MKLVRYRSTTGDLLFRRNFRNLKEKAEKQEIIVAKINGDIHVINIKNIINNQLINNGIKNLILNNKKVIDNNVETMFVLEIIYRSLNQSMEEKTGKELKWDTYISFIDATKIDPSLVGTTKNNNIRMEKITIEGKIKWNKKL